MRLDRQGAALLLVLGVGLGGCGDDDADEGKTSEPATGQTDAAPMAVPDAGAVVTSDTIQPELLLPIVFVHGFAGSAQQYQSQAMRFAANGYPAERIRAYEHDGATTDLPGFVAGTDALVDAVRSEFKTDKVYLVGHSRGTLVSSSYLNDPVRAAKVAKYIALDGAPCPTVVPCLAPNQMNLPGQAHVEVSTSPESFARQFEFLFGKLPSIVKIEPQTTPVVISGRAVNFPENTGRAGSTLQIWELVPSTGARVGTAPLQTFSIGEDGNWGPVTVDPSKYYELALSAPGSNVQHFYGQRFPRSSSFVRLLSGPPSTPTRQNTNSGPGHAAVTVSRMREWMTSDVLEVSTTSASGGSQPALNAITSDVGNNRIAIHLHDDVATPKQSTLALLPWFSMQPFQTGLDLYMPAAEPPDGTITLTNKPRGDLSRPQLVSFPNWASSGHVISVLFADYPQD